MTALRFAHVARLRPGRAADYEAAHRAVPATLEHAMRAAGLRNYTIFRHGDLLFSYCEWEGTDYQSDMTAMETVDGATQWQAAMSDWLEADGEWQEIHPVYRLPPR